MISARHFFAVVALCDCVGSEGKATARTRTAHIAQPRQKQGGAAKKKKGFVWVLMWSEAALTRREDTSPARKRRRSGRKEREQQRIITEHIRLTMYEPDMLSALHFYHYAALSDIRLRICDSMLG